MQWDRDTIRRSLNFTLTTYLESIGLLGRTAGAGSCQDLLPNSNEIEFFGVRCLCLDLENLIRTKRAAGRPKDLESVAELEAIREETA